MTTMKTTDPRKGAGYDFLAFQAYMRTTSQFANKQARLILRHHRQDAYTAA